MTYVIATPSTGTTYNAVAGFNLIESGGLLAALTINLPTGAYDGQFLATFFLNGVTLAGWTGASHNSAPLALSALAVVQFLWNNASTAWHRCA